jgi:pimeloyl-ACP methyl ester carboxylesterase
MTRAHEGLRAARLPRARQSCLRPGLGPPVLGIDLPGRGAHPAQLYQVGLVEWIDSAIDDIERAGVSDAVLVGHSMAGLSIPSILERVPERLRHIVFVCCTVPADGHSSSTR